MSKIFKEIDSITNHWSATFIGVVRQEVNRSAGNSGDIGNSSVAAHDARWMQFLAGGIAGTGDPWANAL